MNNSVKMILVLVVVSLLSGAGLVLMYSYAEPLIRGNENTALENAIFKVLPEAKTYEAIKTGSGEIYLGKDKKGKTVGYAFTATGNGYQGEIKLIAGANPGLEKILAIEILKSTETPGLGGMIAEDDFKNQFKNLVTIPKINLVKESPLEPNDVQAITGATVSSNAVVNIINNRLREVKELIKK